MVKKKYVLYTLFKVYGEKEFKWYRKEYTREQLVGVLASTTVLNNLVDRMEDYTGVGVNKLKIMLELSDKFYFRRKYYLAKYSGDKLVKYVPDKQLLADVEYRRERIATNADRRDKRYQHYMKMIYSYEFRNGPVYGVHHRSYHRGSVYRRPSTANPKRNNYYVDDDYKIYDVKIKGLPTSYDEKCRHLEKSWKKNKKATKQWMKNVKKHSETVRVNKRVYDIDDSVA